MPGEADRSYVIKAKIIAEDHSAAGATSVKRRLKEVEQEGERVGASISGAMSRMFAALAGAAGLGVAVRGVLGLHSAIQDAQGGMATLLSAQTGMGITQTLGIAKGLVNDLRKDAAVGVGELGNYVEGLQGILGPGLAAGASLQQLRELTRLSLAAGFALRGQEGLHLAPRDVRQAMTTGANQVETPIVNQALSAINVTSQAFNKLDAAKRLETLTKAFGTFGPGVALMGKSWSAQMSTMQDGVKGLIVRLTTPLFDRWSGQLAAANRWLVANADQLGVIVDRWGVKLLALWDGLIQRAEVFAALSVAAYAAPGLASGAGGALKTAAGGVVSAAKGWASDPLGIGRSVGGALGTSAAAPPALGASWSAFVSVATRAVVPLALVTTGILAVGGALRQWPTLMAWIAAKGEMIATTLGKVGGAFGTLTADGSALNLVGGALVGTFGGLVTVLDLVLRGIGSLVVGLGVVLQALGEGARLLYYSVTGQGGEALNSSDRLAKVFVDGADRLKGLWTFSDAAGAKKDDGSGDAKGGTGKLSKAPVTNINGPVKFELKVEQNADPARVMVAFEEGVDRLRRFATTARRVPAPG